jgi:hypothetical protein
MKPPGYHHFYQVCFYAYTEDKTLPQLLLEQEFKKSLFSPKNHPNLFLIHLAASLFGLVEPDGDRLLITRLPASNAGN